MTNTLKRQIPELMSQYDVPAVSITLIENSEIVYKDGFGEIDGTPMQSSAVMSAQSFTKPMVAFCALQMVEAGQLALDEPLRDYLDAPYVENEARVNQITARHALSHSTGFPNWRGEDEALTMHFDAGTDFNYSGEGYCYLQTVMEQISGEHLEVMMQSLFEQLGMSDTYMKTFSDEFRQHWLIANYPHLNTNAAFSLMTSADDFAKFMLTMFDEDNQSILDMMLTREQGVDGRKNLHWGNGWGLADTSQGRYFWQWGAGMDERHFAIGNLEQQWAAVIMTLGNQGENKGLELAHQLIRQHDKGFDNWFDWVVR